MAQFLLELYVSRTRPTVVALSASRARSAAAALARDGTPVRYVSSIYVPRDETCFLLYEAETLAAVQEAAARAGLPTDRVLEAQLQHR